MADLRQLFDSEEIAALESWVNQRVSQSSQATEYRGKPEMKLQGRYLQRLKERRDEAAKISNAAEGFRRLTARAWSSSENPQLSTLSAIHKPVAGAAKGIASGIASRLGIITRAAINPVTLAVAAVVKTFDERMSNVEGSMDALAASRGRSAQALQNPFIMGPDFMQFNGKFPSMGTMIHAKDAVWGSIKATWEILSAMAQGNELNNGIPMQRAMSVYWASQKGEPPAIRKWNNIERSKWDDIISRGEFEFGGWRKTPERVGG